MSLWELGPGFRHRFGAESPRPFGSTLRSRNGNTPEETIQSGLSGIEPVTGDRSLGALEEYGRLRAVLKRRVRVEGAMSEAIPLLDHGRFYRLAVETGVGGVFSVEGGSFLPIGERTSDKGVRVRQKGFSRCAAGFSYVAGCLAIPAPLAYWPCHTEDTGGGRERPSFLDCLDWHSRGSACARPCYPPGGSLPSLNQSLREGCRADRAHRWLLSETAAVATVTSMRLKTPAMTTLRYRCTGDGLDCNAIVV